MTRQISSQQDCTNEGNWIAEASVVKVHASFVFSNKEDPAGLDLHLNLAATFAALVEALDEMATRKVAGCVTLQRQINTLMKSLKENGDGKSANAT